MNNSRLIDLAPQYRDTLGKHDILSKWVKRNWDEVFEVCNDCFDCTEAGFFETDIPCEHHKEYFEKKYDEQIKEAEDILLETKVEALTPRWKRL